MNKSKVFISYSHEDMNIVSPLISIMNVISEQVFRDSESIKPGEKWELKIENALENCKIMILFWCFHSSKSEYVKHEYTKAIKTGKRIVPVLLDSTKMVKPLRKYKWIDLKEMLQSFHDSNDFSPSKSPINFRKNDSFIRKEQDEIKNAILADDRNLNKIRQIVYEIFNMNNN